MSEIVIDGADGTHSNTCDPCGADLCNCISSQVGKAVMNTSRTQMKIGSNSYALTIQQEPTVNFINTSLSNVGQFVFVSTRSVFSTDNSLNQFLIFFFCKIMMRLCIFIADLLFTFVLEKNYKK